MPSVEDVALFKVFQQYCSFGSRSSLTGTELSPASHKSLNTLVMDGSKFAKLTREAGLIDGTIITLTEVDITFSKVKDKAERRISFNQFRQALKLLAEKKFHSGDDQLELLEIEKNVFEAVRGLQGPQLAAGTTLPESSQMIDRLMEGPATYISKTPRDDSRAWKDDLRKSPSSPASRRTSSMAGTPSSSRKSSTNPSTMTPT